MGAMAQYRLSQGRQARSEKNGKKAQGCNALLERDDADMGLLTRWVYCSSGDDDGGDDDSPRGGWLILLSIHFRVGAGVRASCDGAFAHAMRPMRLIPLKFEGGPSL